MNLAIGAYLGRPVSELLDTLPFADWDVERSIEAEPRTAIWYEFHGKGVDLICDESDQVRTIFFHRGDGESVIDIPFSLGRTEVLERFGVPDDRGAPVSVPGLGDYGPWDRFTVGDGFLHVQYCRDRDEVEMITLMCADVVP